MTFQHLFSVTIVTSSWSLEVVVTAISGIVIVTSTFVLSGPGSSLPGSRGPGNGEIGFGITLIGTAGEGGTVSAARISIDGFSIVELGCVSSACKVDVLFGALVLE